MADTVLQITEDRSIARKVRDECGEFEASLTHLGTLKDAAEKLAAALPVAARSLASRSQSGSVATW